MSFEILKSSKKRRISGVLFDMDGLVLDTERLYSRFWREAAQELGYPMNYEQSLGLRSLNSQKGEAYLKSLFGPEINYQTVREVRIRRMDAWISRHGTDPKPGIAEILDYLDEHRLSCAITSSSPAERIREYLYPLWLYKRFDAICSGYEVAHGKPEPDIYLAGAKSLNLPPEACLALEDSPAGIESAYRAGCLPVIIPDQDEPDEITLSMCFARADSLADIRGLLDVLNP